jgi:hypothetical protein
MTPRTPASSAHESDLLDHYPEYATTSVLDELRRTDYSRLDTQDQAYLDYTGGGMYADSQVREHVALLTRGVLGNPHSVSLSSSE